MVSSGPLDRCRCRRVAASGTQVSWRPLPHVLNVGTRYGRRVVACRLAAYTPSSASSVRLPRSIMISLRIR
jgi:hypothetical protein